MLHVPDSLNFVIANMAGYSEGQIVYERMRPNQKLVVVAKRGNIYSCISQENALKTVLTYFEKELCASDQLELGKVSDTIQKKRIVKQ